MYKSHRQKETHFQLSRLTSSSPAILQSSHPLLPMHSSQALLDLKVAQKTEENHLWRQCQATCFLWKNKRLSTDKDKTCGAAWTEMFLFGESYDFWIHATARLTYSQPSSRPASRGIHAWDNSVIKKKQQKTKMKADPSWCDKADWYNVVQVQRVVWESQGPTKRSKLYAAALFVTRARNLPYPVKLDVVASFTRSSSPPISKKGQFSHPFW